MIPTMMNCSHSGDGWCLTCVQALNDKLTTLQNKIVPLLDALDFYEKNVPQSPKWLSEGNYVSVDIKHLKSLRDK